MEDADDINNIANDLVDHDVGKGREDEFAGSLYLPRHVHGRGVVNFQHQFRRAGWTLLKQIISDMFEIAGGFRGPAEIH